VAVGPSIDGFDGDDRRAFGSKVDCGGGVGTLKSKFGSNSSFSSGISDFAPDSADDDNDGETACEVGLISDEEVEAPVIPVIICFKAVI